LKQPVEPGLHGAGSAKLAVWVAAAQLLLLALSPALARLYRPDEIGQFAIFSALVAMVATAAVLRYDQVIIVARSAHHARHAAVLAVVYATGIALAVAAAIAAGLDEALAGAFGAGARAWTGWLAPCVLFGAAGVVACGWLLREGRFGAVGAMRLAQNGLVAVFAVAFGLAGMHAGLVAAVVAGLAATAVLAGALLARDFGAMRWPRPARLWASARRYRDFALKGAPAILLNMFALYLPLFFFARFFGEDAGGQFALARQCLLGIFAVFAYSAGQSFLLACTERVRTRGKLRPLLARQLARQAALAAALLAAAWLCAEPIFVWLFGDRWSQAGTYAIWLSIPVAAALLVSPLGGVLYAVERVGTNSAWQIARALAVASLVLIPYGGATGFLATLAMVETAAYAAYLALVVHATARHDRGLAS
jgi:O-antigen/teichoic acid export membrane protein